MNHRCFLLKEKRLPLKESSFSVLVVNEPRISEERLVVFVHNTEDVRPPATGETKSDGTKPAGYGNPGGGLRVGETPEHAVAREIFQETRFVVTRATGVRFDHSLVIPKPDGTMDYTRCDRLGGSMRFEGFDPERGSVVEYLMKTDQLEGVPLPPRQTLTHTFVVEVDWVNNQLHDLFLLQHGLYPESLSSGLILNISPELADKLGIVEAKERPDKRQEIDAIGLFPVSALPNFCEDKRFYRSHVNRAIGATGSGKSRNAR